MPPVWSARVAVDHLPVIGAEVTWHPARASGRRTRCAGAGAASERLGGVTYAYARLPTARA